MAVETDADRLSMFGANDFGVVAHYFSGTKRYSLNGIFDKEYQGVQTADVEFASSLPVFYFPSSQLPCRWAYGDTLVIDDDTYTVRNVEPDGTGVTRLRLEATV